MQKINSINCSYYSFGWLTKVDKLDLAKEKSSKINFSSSGCLCSLMNRKSKITVQSLGTSGNLLNCLFLGVTWLSSQNMMWVESVLSCHCTGKEQRREDYIGEQRFSKEFKDLSVATVMVNNAPPSEWVPWYWIIYKSTKLVDTTNNLIEIHLLQS